MEGFFAEQKKLMARVGVRRRYLYGLIDWHQPCIGILGARGTGKTTLMLQYLRENYAESDRAVYISVDNPFFHARSLTDFGREFHQMGGELLLIDEIHKYPDWSVHVKTMQDSMPDLRIVFSGSSLLQIKKQKGDLSRRAVIYNLHGLSFREYINFVADRDMKPLSFEDVLKSHTIHAPAISGDLKVLRLFRDYMVCGYYPFFLEGAAYYGFKLREVINHIIETDIPYINRIEQRQITKIKRLIYLLATAFPLMTNMQKLSEATEISRPKLYEYLEHLHEARLINLVRGKGRGYEIQIS